jgi:hypothetical protein
MLDRRCCLPAACIHLPISGALPASPTCLPASPACLQVRGLKEQLQRQLAEVQNARTGVVVDGHLRVKGTNGTIFALGDAAVTHQVRSTGRQCAGCAQGLRSGFKCPAAGTSVTAAATLMLPSPASADPFLPPPITSHPGPHCPAACRLLQPLQDKALEDAASLFASADADGDQRLTADEVCSLLKKVGGLRWWRPVGGG